MRQSILRVVALCACLVVAGCMNAGEEHPSIGSGTDDFKESPCACNEIKQQFRQQYVSG